MLNTLRQGAQGWVAKTLMALLVLSFAVWGIGGFQGFRSGVLATVGSQEVTVQDYADLYRQAERVAQQTGQRVSADQVLGQLLANAALDDEAHRNGLGISDGRVAAEIAKSPQFQNTDGSFDRDRFRFLLRNAGMNEDAFVDDTRRQLVRSQIIGSVSAGVEIPQPMVEALHRLQNEERTISYVVVDANAIEPVTEPAEAELQAYFEENKARYRAPEYRKLAILTLDPTSMADPAAVSEDDVKAEYASRKADLSRPERRRVEQITFDSAEAVNEALGAIDAGGDFAEVAQSHGGTVTDLGLKSKAEFLDSAVADAAFAAEPNVAIAVTEGALQPSVIRVAEVQAGSEPTLEELEPRIRRDLATRAARASVNDLYDQVEDERAGGATLQETAQKLSLPYRVVDAVAEDGSTPEGGSVSDIVGESDLLKEAFLSDIGIENSPIRADSDSWVFFEVTDIISARDRTLDEVRDKVLADWTTAETETRIHDKAEALYDRLKAGEALAALATEIGTPVETATGVKRTDLPVGLTSNAVGQAFAGPRGHVANADGEGASRILLQVDNVNVFLANPAETEAIRNQLSGALQNDIVALFNQQVSDSREVDIKSAVYEQLTGQLDGGVPLAQ